MASKALLLWLIALAFVGLVSSNITMRPALSKSLPRPNFDGHDRVILGYRRISPEQAKQYEEAGTVTYTGPRHQTQIGVGTYLTPGYNQWPSEDTDVNCVISADKDKLAATSIVWLPNNVLGSSKGTIARAIKQADPDAKPDSTIRLSVIMEMSNRPKPVYQMLIPPSLLGSGASSRLDLQVNCEKYPGQPGIRGPSVDFFQWRKGPVPKEPLTESDKIGSIGEMRELLPDEVVETFDLQQIGQARDAMTGAIYDARQGAEEVVTKWNSCQNDLKAAECKGEILAYLDARKSYANFIYATSERTLQILEWMHKSERDGNKKAEVVKKIDDFATSLEEQTKAKKDDVEILTRAESETEGFDGFKALCDLELLAIQADVEETENKSSNLVTNAKNIARRLKGEKVDEEPTTPNPEKASTKIPKSSEITDKEKGAEDAMEKSEKNSEGDPEEGQEYVPQEAPRLDSGPSGRKIRGARFELDRAEASRRACKKSAPKA
ncbi:hypothetical protein XA68_12490 [Ophiocordyceps unilateralis]|uniref:Uncharacterized protein n=1 Tax=Ophiocordyceps unilateralis TaxID=268505 RepID=A0A2A9PDE2_OPHUN|nr:hypothetical protein XA68_12490 [Ophiocordyceps unilateralis]